jgi:hypothetical protein
VTADKAMLEEVLEYAFEKMEIDLEFLGIRDAIEEERKQMAVWRRAFAATGRSGKSSGARSATIPLRLEPAAETVAGTPCRAGNLRRGM